MSKMSDLHLSISQDIEAGNLSFAEIAQKYNVPFDWVNTMAVEMAADGDEARYDDSMDGDFDSAMASAGHGTDEDYGYYGDWFYRLSKSRLGQCWGVLYGKSTIA